MSPPPGTTAQRRINHMGKANYFELKIPPLAVFLVFVALMWLVAIAVPSAGITLPEKNPIAAAIAVIGGVIAGAGILSLLRARTTLNPFEPGKSASLVTTGIYAVTRNPMYLSLLFVLVGWAVYLSNPATLVLIPVFMAYMNRFQIVPEERALSSLFGSEFEAYCKRVRRWL